MVGALSHLLRWMLRCWGKMLYQDEWAPSIYVRNPTSIFEVDLRLVVKPLVVPLRAKCASARAKMWDRRRRPNDIWC